MSRRAPGAAYFAIRLPAARADLISSTAAVNAANAAEQVTIAPA
jgi:hypothetical protein